MGRNSTSKSLKIIRPLDGGRSSRVVNTTQLVSELASLGSVLILPSSTNPVRSREDADSALIREKVWDWYKSDLSTRLKPGGRIVLIQTRWHEDDLAGRLLLDMQKGGDRWEVLCLPAVATDGDPLGRVGGEVLWDDSYGYGDFIRHEKATQSPRNWDTLYPTAPH